MNALTIVQDYLNTLQAERYDVRLIHADPSQMVFKREWTKEELLKCIDFLKAKNCKGYNIYCRPVGYEFILVDDVRPEYLEKATTFNPAALIETSPKNFQVWYILKETPINREQAKAVCIHLANELGGDTASAEPDHIGRLPQFTNRKPKHKKEDGYFHFVRQHLSCFRYCTLNLSDFPAESGFDAHSESKSSTHRKGTSHDNSRSGQDFNLACMLIRKGLDDNKIFQRLKDKSEKAKEQRNPEKYLELTIAKAHIFVNS